MEDIKRCEELIKEEHSYWIGISNQKAIENLLKQYKELEEENESLVRQYEYQGALMVNEYFSKEQVFKHFIPISVIQNKIEEMDKIINSPENKNHIHTKIEASIVKGELQELLEERNK